MRSLINSVLMLFVGLCYSQSINSVEYFFDTDLGVGNGMTLSADTNTGELSQTYLIDISSLSNGFHDLYIRTFNDENNWSHYDRSTFYIAAFNAGQNIVAAEYFYDLDEGVGMGDPLDVNPETPLISQSFMIPTTGLDEGFHNLYIRTQIADGTWSLYDRQVIYLSAFENTTSEVDNAEYFIDLDPGVGLGESLSITSSSQVITFDIDGLSEGDHLFCVRVQNEDGNWSLYDCEIFTIDSSLGLDKSLFKSVNVSPNPFSSTLNLEISRSVVLRKISVYDITGKEVYTTSDDLRKIDLENLEAGTYILSLMTENEKATFKIIKQ